MLSVSKFSGLPWAKSFFEKNCIFRPFSEVIEKDFCNLCEKMSQLRTPTLGSLKVTLGPSTTIGQLRVTLGHIMVTISYIRVILRMVKVILG